jgi:hypothetical protein
MKKVQKVLNTGAQLIEIKPERIMFNISIREAFQGDGCLLIKNNL